MSEEVEECDFCTKVATYQEFVPAHDGGNITTNQYPTDRYLYCKEHSTSGSYPIERNNMSRYEHTEIDEDEAAEITAQPGWDLIGETTQSELHWNENTGELIRIPGGKGSKRDPDDSPTYQKLKEV
jgi:hypothetical protein